MLTSRITLCVLLATSTIGYSQTKAVRAKTPLIEVRAVVTDHQGKPVDSLAKDDFLLLEDNVQQPVSLFSLEKIEAKTGDQQSPTRDMATTAPKEDRDRSAQPVPSRALALLVDTTHLSHNGLEGVKAALKRFVADQVTSQDLVALLTTAGKPGAAGEFTRDRDKLRAAIEKIRPGQVPPESFLTPALCGKVGRRDVAAVTLAVQIIQSEERTSGSFMVETGPSPEVEATSKCMMLLLQASSERKAVMSSIKTASERLAAIPGQRIIALFSDGFSMTAAGGEVAIADVQPAISKASSAGVWIYTYNARGMQTEKQINIGSFNLSSEMNDSARDFQHGMALLASQTGGEAFFNITDFSAPMQKMLDGNRIYYQLGYSPPVNQDPRKYRSIAISVKGHPEYRIRAQKGYALSDLQSSK